MIIPFNASIPNCVTISVSRTPASEISFLVARVTLPMIMVFLCAASLVSALADEATAVNCGSMSVKRLRVWLAERGLQCNGCAEKSDYVALCNANLEVPVLMKKPQNCVDLGPFKCFEAYCSTSPTVDCELLGQYFCSSPAEAVWHTLPHTSMSGRTIGDLCPQSCNLCNAWCDQQQDQDQPRDSPSWSQRQLAASRQKPNNNSCVAAHWVDAVRTSVQSKGGRQPGLERTMLAKALLHTLDDELLHLSACSSVPLVCMKHKLQVQSWTLETLRSQPLHSCPANKDVRAIDVGTDDIYIRPSAEELSSAALTPSTTWRTKLALRRAGVAGVVGALGQREASDLRETLLAEWQQFKKAPILESSHRQHVMLQPDTLAIARALTALGVRIDETGRRRGLLAHIVPDGAAITELAAIIVRSGATAQELHSDTESHYGDATMTTAFVTLQTTTATLGALHFVPGSHTTGTREPEMHCGGGEPALNGSGALRSLDLPSGTAMLMDSRLLHHGGAHTVFTASPAVSLRSKSVHDPSDATARVVFYFSWVNPRTSSTSFLPMGSTFALRGELWGRLTVPLRETFRTHHSMHARPASGLAAADDKGHQRAWTILDLVTARIELCTRGNEWNVNVALRCLLTFGAANAATLFVCHRENEHAQLGVERAAWCAA